MDSDEFDEETRLEAAAEVIHELSDAKICKLAREFHVDRNKLRRRVAGTGPSGGRHASNARLNEAEEDGLIRYITHLDDMNISVRRLFVEEAANAILRRKIATGAPRHHRLECAGLAAYQAPRL